MASSEVSILVADLNQNLECRHIPVRIQKREISRRSVTRESTRSVCAEADGPIHAAMVTFAFLRLLCERASFLRETSGKFAALPAHQYSSPGFWCELRSVICTFTTVVLYK